MTVGIGAAGVVGLAHETTPGTYAAPTIYLPVRSESVQFINEVQYTRPIIGQPDNIHAVEGPQRVEGDLEFEVIEDLLAFLLYGARMTVNKTGLGPFVYTFSPSPAAEAPNKTLSITVERNGEVFGYTGCAIPGLELSVDSGLLVCTANVLGRGEATQPSPTPTWPETPPFGADAYTLEIGGTPITKADNFSWSLDDSGEAVYRLGNAQQAAYVKFGERSVSASLELDFENRTEYDNFKAVTERQLQFDADKDAGHYVHIDTKTAIASTYEVMLSGQGDLVRASVEYEGKHDFVSGKIYEIEISCDEDIT